MMWNLQYEMHPGHTTLVNTDSISGETQFHIKDIGFTGAFASIFTF